MKFINSSQSVELTFSIDMYGPFDVAPGDIVDIPDRVAFCVTDRGIPLDVYVEPPPPKSIAPASLVSPTKSGK